MGIEKTFSKVGKCYWWPGMRRSVLVYVSSCTHCQLNKPQPGRPVRNLPQSSAHRQNLSTQWALITLTHLIPLEIWNYSDFEWIPASNTHTVPTWPTLNMTYCSFLSPETPQSNLWRARYANWFSRLKKILCRCKQNPPMMICCVVSWISVLWRRPSKQFSTDTYSLIIHLGFWGTNKLQIEYKQSTC